MSDCDPIDTYSLKKIAIMGGCKGPVKLSTHSFGIILDISQQTASRRLKSLETAGLISRSIVQTGQYVFITDKGSNLLRKEYSEYCQIFNHFGKHYVLNGIITSGMGEGRYYMSIPHYQDMFKKLCGFSPYPGTINIKLNQQSVLIRKHIDSLDCCATIPSFCDNNRTFGAAKCIPCKIDTYQCAIVIPFRTHYPDDIIEVISNIYLRGELNLKDGDSVDVIIDTTKTSQSQNNI